jgi:hypothetical protein
MANEAQSSGGFSGGGGGGGTVTIVSIVTAQGVSGVVANDTTTPAITLTLGALTGVTSFNGLVVTANTGVITTGTWAATTIGATVGGTGQTVYAVGDLLYASTTTALSKLTDVAAGSYLRSGGVNTAPLWSTLILPNSATANRLAYATATNTWGDNSLLTFDGTIFTANALKSNGSGAYIGATVASATVPLNITVGQNNKTSLNITNSTAGASASTRLEMFNDVGSVINFGLNSSTTTPYGMNAAGDGYIYSGRSFGLMSDVVGGVIRFAAGGNSQIAEINNYGIGIGTSATSTARFNVSANQNATTSFDVLNSNGGAGAYTRMKITNDASNYIQMTMYGSATTAYGMNASGEANLYTPVNLNIFADGASKVIKFAAGGSTEVARIASAGMSIKTTSTPTAYLMFGAGTATASTAPLKFTSGTNLTTAEAGAMEYNGTNLFFTRSGTTRQTVLTGNVVTTEVIVSDTSITVNIAGTDYKLLARA